MSTELYPYEAASTGLQTAIFDLGWQNRMEISFGDVLWPATGERLTAETFAKYRAQGGPVVIFSIPLPAMLTLRSRTARCWSRATACHWCGARDIPVVLEHSHVW